MDILGAGHVWGVAKRPSKGLLKICDTYPKMMKLGTIIPYLEKNQKIYESRDTPSDISSANFSIYSA